MVLLLPTAKKGEHAQDPALYDESVPPGLCVHAVAHVGNVATHPLLHAVVEGLQPGPPHHRLKYMGSEIHRAQYYTELCNTLRTTDSCA